MPPEKDENLDGLNSSEQANDVTEVVEASAETGEGAADPSSATSEKPEDMLSVVRDVVSPSEETASQAKDNAQEPAEVAGDKEPKEQDDTDYSDVPFNKHPRFQQLLRKAKTYEEDAGRYRSVETFLSENHLSSEEAADGLRIMALAKTDPAKALAEIKPFVQKLLMASGEVLPDDLKTRVQSGEFSPEAALEISRSRAQLASQQQTQEMAEQRRQQESLRTHANSLRDAALVWASDRDTKDPSFREKYPLIEREIAFLQRNEGIPNTAEGVRDQLNRAYAEVNQQARAAAPTARQPRVPVRPLVGGAAPGTHKPEPTSMIEAIRAARGA